MSPAAPRVSVGLPVYNGAPLVEKALTSLCAQDFADFELIVSDNASSDGTEAICRQFAERDRRVRYVRHDANRGAAWNYNHVFGLARGAYFKWAAHDDLCARGLLARCVETLDREGPDVVLCYPQTLILDERLKRLAKYDDRLDLRQPRPHERVRHLIANLRRCHAVFGVIRRDALARTRLVGAYPHADRVLLLELALLGQFREVPEQLFMRRLHDKSSLAANRGDRDLHAWYDPNDREHRARLPESRLYEESVAAIARSPLSDADKDLCLRAYREALRARNIEQTGEIVVSGG